jgi:hypothetical protein
MGMAGKWYLRLLAKTAVERVSRPISLSFSLFSQRLASKKPAAQPQETQLQSLGGLFGKMIPQPETRALSPPRVLVSPQDMRPPSVFVGCVPNPTIVTHKDCRIRCWNARSVASDGV